MFGFGELLDMMEFRWEAYFESKPVKVLENAVLVTGYVALLMDGSVWTWEYNYVGKWCLLKEKQL